MDPPQVSDGGQPDSYTSSLLPGSAEQSSPMSDFTTGMDPFLMLPLAVQEPQHSLPETGSLRQVPVHPSRQQQQEQPCSENHYSSQGSNTSAPPPAGSTTNTNASTITSTTNSNTHHQKHAYQPPRSQQMWQTPPSAADEPDHFCYDSSPPTCGSGASTSNFSPASAAGTWPSPATSFQQPADHRPVKDIWGGGEGTGADFDISTPVSVDVHSHAGRGGVGSAAASDISAQCDGGYQDPSPFGLDGTEWHCEPLGATAADTEADADAVAATFRNTLAGVPSASCPASPAMMPMSSTTAYMVRGGRLHDSPAGPFDVDMASSRASEPPMHDSSGAANANANANGANAEQQIPYAQLIYKALIQAPEQSMCLQEIYQWFQNNTDKCKEGQKGWMNSIRHNLSMNAGFTKRDLKRGEESLPPSAPTDADETQSNDEPKRSTEWTLTDNAIANGIQSTTRYRNKKSEPRDSLDHGLDRDARLRTGHSPLYQQYQHRLSTNRLGHRRPLSAICDGGSRVSKPYGRCGGQGLRAGPTSAASASAGGYVARSSSPAGAGLYFHSQQHEALMAQVMTTAAGHGGMSSHAGAYGYGIMMPHPHDHTHQQYVLHHSLTGTFDISTTTHLHPSSSSMYLAPPTTAQAHPPPPPPPPPPRGLFPYDTIDVNLGYSSSTTSSSHDATADASRPARLYPTTDMPHGLYNWPSSHGY